MAVRNSINGALLAFGLQVVNATANGFSSVQLADGQMLIGTTGGAAVAAAISASNGIAATLGAGTFALAGTAASDTAVGVVELATDAEAIAGTDTSRAIVASSLKAKLGLQTLHALPVAAGDNAAMAYVGPLTDGQLLIGSTGAQPVPAVLSAGAGISITNSAGSVTIAASGSVAGWSTIGASQAAVKGNGYFVTANALSISLPATSAVGDTFEVSLAGGTSWTLTQGAGQQIFFGSASSSSGAGGSVASTANGDSVRLVCFAADTNWQIVSSVGNLNLV